jgi:hypothetical protein
MDLFDGQAAGARPIVPRYARDFGLTDASGIADEVVRTAMQVCRQAQLA